MRDNLSVASLALTNGAPSEQRTVKHVEIAPLTSLRFVAALTVVISHIHGLGFANLTFLHDFFDGGRPAVSFFFILSGFILTYNYRRIETSTAARGFWGARFARIYPVHLLGLTVAIAGFITFYSNGNLSSALDLYSLKPTYKIHNLTTGPGLFLGLSLVGQILLLAAWLPFAVLNQPWNGPAWSISCEAFFYATFPWISKRVFRDGARPITLAIALFGTQIFIICALKMIGGKTNFLISQFPLTHFPDFFIGVTLGYFHVEKKINFIRNNSTWIFLGSLVVIGLISAWHPVNPMYVILEPIFAVLILSAANLRLSIVSSILANRGFGKLGEASYSLYILHVPCLSLLLALGIKVPWQLILLGLIGLSLASHALVEEPARKRLRKALSR